MSAVAPRFIFTVDVEVGKSHDAEARIWGRCVEGEFGIGFQLEQLRQRGFGGSFFVNVYESRRHGAEFFGKVCRRIVESGSDVELHTHPDGWTEDWSRPYMWRYTLAEQVELVRLGQKMLADWTGSPAIAHRAGSFAANDDTLRACIANGLRIDSSEAFGWSRCRLPSSLERRNVPHVFEGSLLEIPVTTYQDLWPSPHVQHLDINASTTAELRSILDRQSHARQPVLCLVMHSFSFVERRDGQWHSRRPDIDRFLWLLDTLKAQQAQVVRMRTLSAQSLAGEEATDRAVPALRTSWLHTYGRAVQRARRSWKMAVLAIAPWLMAAVCVTAWVVYGRIG